MRKNYWQFYNNYIINKNAQHVRPSLQRLKVDLIVSDIVRQLDQLENVARKCHVMAAMPNIGVGRKRHAVLSNYKADVYEPWQLWLERDV